MDDFERQKLLRKVGRAKENQKWDLLAKSCRKLAEHASNHGRFEEALSWYSEERYACELQGDMDGVANANRMLGETYNELGQFQQSVEHVNKYLEYAKKVKDKVEEQRALATIGRTYFCWSSELKNSTDKTTFQVMLRHCRKAYMKSLFICENQLEHIGNKERSEMKARLLFNLGLVAELQEEYETARNYIFKAIQICRQENLYEDLHRCYLAQSGIYSKQDNSQSALNALDAALDIAKLAPQSTEKTVVTLQLKAEIYLQRNNFQGAKNILIKAYKLKTPNETDQNMIEKSLKQAIALCKAEEDLIALPIDDFKNRKPLYEKLGDGCCAVNNFSQGIQYYLKMLDCAEKIGETEQQLLPCYVSLGQTYKDNKQYDLALEYCQKELEIVKSAAESAKTYINIGEILELIGEKYSDICEAYNKAIELSKESGNRKIEITAMKCLLNLQKKLSKDDLVEKTKNELEILKKKYNYDSEEESTSSEDEDTPDIGKDINLEDLLSDSDQEKEEYDRPRTRNPRAAYKIKRNEKGETQLHVAIIKGDLSRARRLIEQGHPMMEQDLNGWTPLHEACNHGHLEIVDLLLTNGADINDPGGKGCDGVTPLHDAASCGHFDIINLLLEKGASVTAQTKNGETPLDCFQDWRKRVTLDYEDKIKYAEIVDKLKSVLDAAGFVKTTKNKNNIALIPEIVPTTKKPSLRRTYETDSTDLWRETSPETESKLAAIGVECSSDNEPDDADSTDLEINPYADVTEVADNPTKEYKKAMDAVRKRREPVALNTNVSKVNSALLPEENVVDDWLEDDLKVFQQPEKRRKMLDLLEHSTVRKKNKDGHTKSKSKTPENREETKVSRKEEPKVNIVLKETQNTLAEASIQTNKPEDTQRDIPLFATVNQTQITQCSMAKVRVKIDGTLFLVPVPFSSRDENIDWLCKEASKRYYQIKGAEPSLQLRTKDGAILCPTDPISLIWDEEIEGVIIEWKFISLLDRYKEECSKRKPERLDSRTQPANIPDEQICKVLKNFEATKILNFNNFALTAFYLAPFFLALKHVNYIKTLNLCGNMLEDDGVVLLCESLQKLDTIEEINLKCNSIQDFGVKMLCATFRNKSKSFLKSLTSLDLSYNSLTDASLEELSLILDVCGCTLLLRGCQFTREKYDSFKSNYANIIP